MSRLINLYTDDGRVVVGRTAAPFPISVNTGFAVVGPIVTGYIPVTRVVTTTVISRRPMPFFRFRTVVTTTTRVVTSFRPAAFFAPIYFGGVF